MTNTQRQKSNTLPRPLRIFLSHISEDKPRVLQIYEWLKAFGTDPWLDKAKLTGGDKWEQRIKTEMKRSDLIIICLSESAIKKRGYFQVEITEALALAQREPEGFTLIIPVFLELCTLPDRLSSFHAVNLYEPSGVHNLVQALSKRANELPGVFFNTPEVVPELIIQLIQIPAPIPAKSSNSTPIKQPTLAPTNSTGLPTVPISSPPAPSDTINSQIREPESEKKSTRRNFIVKSVAGAFILAAGGTATTLLIRSCTTKATSEPSPIQSSNGISYTFATNSQVRDWLPSGPRVNKSSLAWDQSGHNAPGSLKVNTYLWGKKNPNRPNNDDSNHTEIALYFHLPQPYYNFSGKRASCWVFVPEPQATDGVYLSIFVKSYPGINIYPNQDGGQVFLNNLIGTWSQLSITIGNFDPASYHDLHFDPTRVAAFGVLIQADDNSIFAEKNIQFYIDDCTIS